MSSATRKPRTMKPPVITVRPSTTRRSRSRATIVVTSIPRRSAGAAERWRRPRPGGLIEFLHRVVEMRSELIVQPDEALELPTDLGDALLQLAGALLHGEPADPKSDDLQVCEERVRRRRDHVPLLEVGAKIRLV